MKRIKGLILVLLVFLISGCSVKYNAYIDGTKLSETITIPYDGDTLEEKVYYDLANDKYYNTKIKNNKLILTNKNQNIGLLANNDLYRYCYNDIVVVEEDDYYSIGTTKQFNCTYQENYEDIDSLEITFKTYNKVKQSNADKKTLNSYTWIINKNNYTDKNIIFVVSKNEYVWYYSYMGIIPGILIVIGILLLIMIIRNYFVRRSNRVNKF